MLNSSQDTPVEKSQHSGRQSAIRSARGLASVEAPVATAIVVSSLVATGMGQYDNSNPSETILDVSISNIAR